MGRETPTPAPEARFNKIHENNIEAISQIENCLVANGPIDRLGLNEGERQEIKTRLGLWCSEQRDVIQKNMGTAYSIPWDEVLANLAEILQEEKITEILKNACPSFESYNNPEMRAAGESPRPPEVLSDIQTHSGGQARQVAKGFLTAAVEMPASSQSIAAMPAVRMPEEK